MKRIIIATLLSLSILSCSKQEDVIDDDDTTTPNTETNDGDVDDSFDTNSKDTVFSNAVTIRYAAGSITVTNPYENKGVSISIEGGNAIVTSTLSDTEINYVLSGTHTDGSFKIYSAYKFGLGLNGVNLICSNAPAINIQSGKKASVYLVGGTNNRLIDNNSYAESEEDRKGTFFSEGQLVFSGSGNLILKGYYKHAIASDDYVRIDGGNITVQSAYKDGIHANDSFVMDGGTLTIDSSGEGIQCESGPIEINGGKLSIKTPGAASKAIQAEGDMTVSGGETTLIASGDGLYDTEDKDLSSAAGIKCNGNLVIEKGTVTINSTGAGGKGINVDGTLAINGGTIQVTTSGAQYKYGMDDTAAKAIKSDGNLTINGGNISVKTSGTEAEGIESKTILTINKGTIEVEAYDDCINASNQILINGGNIYCYSTTNDGIDSNGTLTITGGTIVSSGSTSPEEGFDCDNNTFKITGGTLLGIGGATSTPSSSASTQRSVIYGGSGSANQLIHIESSDGTQVLTYKIPRSYNQMTLLLSSPSLAGNTTYTIYTGGSISGGSDFHGFYSGATYAQGTAAKTFTTSSMVTTVGTTSGGGGGRP